MTCKPPRIEVAFRLTGQGFSLDDVTAMVQLTPTNTWRAGDLIARTIMKRKHDGWTLELLERETFDMEESLRELLDVLEPHQRKIIEAMDRFKLDAEISFGVLIYESEPAAWFSADTIRRAALLNASLDIDLIHTEK
jgi:hypothetical protein